MSTPEEDHADAVLLDIICNGITGVNLKQWGQIQQQQTSQLGNGSYNSELYNYDNIRYRSALQQFMRTLDLLLSPDQQNRIVEILKEPQAPEELHIRPPAPFGDTEQNNSVTLTQFQQQLIEVSRVPKTPDEQRRILQMLTSNPELRAAFMKHRQTLAHGRKNGGAMNTVKQCGQLQQQQTSQLSNGSDNSELYNNHNIRYRRALQQFMQTLDLLLSPDQQNRIIEILKEPLAPEEPHIRPPAPTFTFGDSQQNNSVTPTQLQQQLIEATRVPRTPDEQRRILQMLKSNPELMAAFIKHRKTEAHGWQYAGTMKTEGQGQRYCISCNTDSSSPSPILDSNAIPAEEPIDMDFPVNR